MATTITEVVTVGGLREERQVRRLTAAEHEQVINDFARFMLGDDVADDDFDAYASGCVVAYRDDESGESWYEVTDARGHGDGSGEWTAVG